MTFIEPAWLHLAWIVLVILVLRWFVLGRRSERVSTLLLWRRVLAEAPMRSRGRFRPDVESTVEAFLGLALVALVAGPSWRSETERPPLVIVDDGAAMAASGRRAVVERVLAGLPPGATVERTDDVRRAVAAVRGVDGRPIIVVADALDAAAPADVAVVVADAPVANVGITAVDGRRRGDVVELFVVVESSGPEGAARVHLVREGERVATAAVVVAPDQPAETILTARVPGEGDLVVELETDLVDEVGADDAVRLEVSRDGGTAWVRPGLDPFVDALESLGLAVVGVDARTAVAAGDLLVGRDFERGVTRAILLPPAVNAPLGLSDATFEGGILAAASQEFDDVPVSGLEITRFREVVGGRPLLRIGDRAAAAVQGGVVVLGFDPAEQGLAERPEFVLLVRALVTASGFVPGTRASGDHYRTIGLLDREETLARATPGFASAGRGPTRTVRTMTLRPWIGALALALLGLLAAIRSRRS